MIDEKTGGYAFPAIGESNTPGGTRYVFNEGMTMLDHFAGLAMQAIIAKLPLIDQKGEFGTKLSEEEKIDFMAEVGKSSYQYAGFMIAERNRLMNEKP